MMFIYVTGVSGSGKSAVKAELIKRGYTALDVDEDNFKRWYNRETDELAEDQKDWNDAESDRAWLEQYWLKIERDRVLKLKEQSESSDKPVFLTGSTPNDADIWDLFDKVFFLRVSNQTLEYRIRTRTSNSYGKHPDDLKNILNWNLAAEARNVEKGAVVVDAEQPISGVVDDILGEVDGR